MFVTSSRSAALNAIRGSAALMVFVMHFVTIPISTKVNFQELESPTKYLWSIIFAGYTGVGIFIFLSGYLPTQSVIANQENLITYLSHRWLRIYPVYLLILLFAILASRQWDWQGFLNAIFLFPNLPGTLWPFPYLATAWSLGIEWTLYFTLFFLILLGSRRKEAIIFQALLILLMFIASLEEIDKHSIVYGSIFGRLIQFSLGSHLAIYILNFKKKWLEKSTMSIGNMALPSAILIFIAWANISMNLGGPNSNGNWRFFEPYIESLICVCLIIWAEFGKSERGKPVIKILNFLGKVSYPFYLIHLTILVGISQKFNWLSHYSFWINFNLLLMCSLFLSILFAWLIHYSIEVPIESWKTQRRVNRRGK